MNELLELVDDIVLFEDPGILVKKYFLVSNKRNIHLKLDKDKFNLLNELIPYFNGEKCKEDIEEKLEGIYNNPVNLDNAITFFKKFNLFKHQEVENKSKIEFELKGKKIKEFNIEQLSAKKISVIKNIHRFIFIISIISFIYALYLIISSPGTIFQITKETNTFKWSTVAKKEYIYFIIGFFLSVICHELGHIFTAIAQGVAVKSVTITLVYGISPVVYVKYKDLNLNKSTTKIKIILGGVFINLFFMSILFIVLNFSSYWLFAALMLVNLGFIFNTLSLMGTTDGYFAVTTIFDIEGLRWNTLKAIGQVLSKRKGISYLFRDIKTISFVIYIIISYLLSFFMLKYYIEIVAKYIKLSSIYMYLLNIGLIIFILGSFVIYTFKFLNSLKKM